MIKIDSVKISAKLNINDKDGLKEIISNRYKIRSEIKDFNILKKSIDARDKNDILYLYSISMVLSEKEEKYLTKKYKNINDHRSDIYRFEKMIDSYADKNTSIIICGMGPAGLFCALLLIKHGFDPILIERGKKLEDRIKDVEDFWNGYSLDIESNVQFGEGGAGTFSDGKLNTGIKDREGRKEFVLKTFVEFGADENILYDSKPHIGTDVLRKVIKNMREYILNNGGKIYYSTKLISVINENSHIKKIKVLNLSNNEERCLDCDKLVLAIGHSARDTFEMLKPCLTLEAKAFAMGFRVIHTQEFINKAQYGEDYEDMYEGLPSCSYKLTNQNKDRGVYSFCMCPGGYVVNASSESKKLCINGMSDHKRDSGFANSAIIVQIKNEDLKDKDIFYGLELQRQIEEKAYNVGKGRIPVSYLEDFYKDLNIIPDIDFDEKRDLKAGIKGDFFETDITGLYPEYINIALAYAFVDFDKKIKDFAKFNPMLLGCETRSSSPVKIIRDADYESNIKGIYPCGEGAGYAGGIVSAAVDGLKVAEIIIEQKE